MRSRVLWQKAVLLEKVISMLRLFVDTNGLIQEALAVKQRLLQQEDVDIPSIPVCQIEFYAFKLFFDRFLSFQHSKFVCIKVQTNL
jgi:hypothetical protein